MPRWLSSTLVVIGFLALVGLAFIPRNIEVTVTTNVDDRDYTFHGDPSLHAEPETADPQDGD